MLLLLKTLLKVVVLDLYQAYEQLISQRSSNDQSGLRQNFIEDTEKLDSTSNESPKKLTDIIQESSQGRLTFKQFLSFFEKGTFQLKDIFALIKKSGKKIPEFYLISN